jgi:hypothetical protein
VLKPNGEILKHYGEDYFDLIGEFLSTPLKIKSQKE